MQNRFYRIYEILRYEIPYFIKNLWVFKDALWSFRDYDAIYSLCFLHTSLVRVKENLKNKSYEIETSLNPKLKRIDRCIEILNNINKDRYLDISEERLGKTLPKCNFTFTDAGGGLFEMNIDETEEEKMIRNEIFELSNRIEKEEWLELWDILKGNHDLSDGSNLRSWWN